MRATAVGVAHEICCHNNPFLDKAYVRATTAARTAVHARYGKSGSADVSSALLDSPGRHAQDGDASRVDDTYVNVARRRC
jgi:hypothetical protein